MAKANIEIASVNTSSGELCKTLNHVVEFIYDFHDVEVIDYKIENL